MLNDRQTDRHISPLHSYLILHFVGRVRGKMYNNVTSVFWPSHTQCTQLLLIDVCSACHTSCEKVTSAETNLLCMSKWCLARDLTASVLVLVTDDTAHCHRYVIRLGTLRNYITHFGKSRMIHQSSSQKRGGGTKFGKLLCIISATGLQDGEMQLNKTVTKNSK
jgi:hypothetical protein